MKNNVRRLLQSLLLLICSVAFSLIIGEAFVRLFGHYDVDGNFFVGTLRLKPYVLNVKNISNEIQQYLASNDSYIMYNPSLGWSSRPESMSRNGLYCFNSDGLRTATVNTLVSKIPSTGTLRIAIFGDSFTFGDDVPFKNTWGYYLEDKLRKHGVNAEVLNFGMAGYGIDQAFLRWQNKGRLYLPQIVILGLCTENKDRNTNLIRPFYRCQRGMPFSKPRFVEEGGKLKLLNVPSLPPEKLLPVINKPVSWNLIKYEEWYNHDDYNKSVLYKSRLYSFVARIIDKINDSINIYRYKHKVNFENNESVSLALKIIQEFKKDAQSNKAKFYVVFLPGKNEIKALSKSNNLFFVKLLDRLDLEATVIRPEYKMLQQANKFGIDTLFKGHYTSLGNGLVADSILEYLLKEEIDKK